MLKPSKTTQEAGLAISDDYGFWGDTLGAAVELRYGYVGSDPTYAGTPRPAGTFGRLFTPAQIYATELVLDLWSDVANVSFTRDNPTGYSNSATMLFGNYVNTNDPGAARGAPPEFDGKENQGVDSIQGDVWVNTTKESNKELSPGEYGFYSLLHEVGHALGLAHPGPYSADDATAPTYSADVGKGSNV